MASMNDIRKMRLEPFSARVAKWLLDEFPEWQQLVKPVHEVVDGFAVNYLVIHVPSQNPSVREPLTLAVNAQKVITVSWFYMWAEYRWNVDYVTYMEGVYETFPENMAGDAGLKHVTQFLRDFFDERLVACCSEDSFGAAEVESARVEPFVRSWRGTHDWGDQLPRGGGSPLHTSS